MRVSKKATSQLYLYIRRRGIQKGRSTIYALTTEYFLANQEQRLKRLEKGREADDVVFPLNSGKYVIKRFCTCTVLQVSLLHTQNLTSLLRSQGAVMSLN